MLEAKDQGHKHKCSPKKKKKVFAKIFQAISKKNKKKKKRSSQKFFKRSPRKNVFQKIFQALHKILSIQKIVLSSSRGQANFRGLEASRPRGQGQGLDLRGQGQGLQNVSSRTSSRPRTSSRTPPLACAGQQSFIILNSCNFACKYKKITEILSL